MRILLTGVNGFVGPYVARALHTLGDIDGVDLTDAVAVDAAIARHRPSHVNHLAGVAAPAAARAEPQAAREVNLGGTLNLARTILARAPECRPIFIGSGLVCGDSARSGRPSLSRRRSRPCRRRVAGFPGP